MKKTFKSAISLLLAAVMVIPATFVFAAEEAATVHDPNLAYVDFSYATPKMDNLSVIMANGASIVTEVREGRRGWVLRNKGVTSTGGGDYTNDSEATMNIDLSKSFAFDVNDGSTYVVEVDYYDEGQGVFSLVYDAQDKPNRFAGSAKTNQGARGEYNNDINAWRTASFLLQDAKFANSFDFCDFKVSTNIMNYNNGYYVGYKTSLGGTMTRYAVQRYMRVSSTENVLIGAIRVRKIDTVNPFAYSIKSDAYGDNFFDDDEVSFDITLKNNTDKAYELATTTYAISDENLEVFRHAGPTVSIGANETKTFTFKEENVPYGIFDYNVEFTADGVKTVVSTGMSHAREAKIQNEAACTNIHLEQAHTYETDHRTVLTLIRKAGYFSTRDSYRWPDMQSAKDKYHMLFTHNITVDISRELGLDVFPIQFCTKPGWLGETSSPLSTPEDFEIFSKYCEWFAQQMSDVTTAVEAQNEYNLAFPTATSEMYVQYMKTMYESWKKVKPDLKVVGVDIGGFDAGLIRRLFEAGALEYMDAVSYHPYDWTKPVEVGSQFSTAKTARELMAEFGGADKELWCTETGWYHNTSAPCEARDKAHYYARALLQNNALKVFDRIYFYEFMNSGIEPSYGESFYGTIRSSMDGDDPYLAEPGYLGTCTANWLLGGATFIDAADGKGADLNANTYAYRWKRADANAADGLGSQFIGLWTTRQREEMGLKLGVDEVTVVDIYGNANTMKPVNGVYNFTISEEPIYLIGDFTTFTTCEPTVDINNIIAAATVDDTIVVELDIPGLASGTLKPVDGWFELVENTGVVNGKAKYVVKTPSARFYNKTVKFDVLDSQGNTVYCVNVKINNEETITVKESHYLVDDNSLNRWAIDIDITNNRNSSPVNGTFFLNAPLEVTKYITKVAINELQPKATLTYRFFMPEVVTKEMRDYSAKTILSNGETFEDSHKMFFTSVPYAHTKPTIDGVAARGEYNDDAWFPVTAGENKKNVAFLTNWDLHQGDQDLSAKSTMLWDEEYIYFFIEVTDDVFVNNQVKGVSNWNGDSVQIGLANAGTTGAGGYAELTFALTKEGPCLYRHLSNNIQKPIGIVENCDIQIIRVGNKTNYELAIPWEEAVPEYKKIGPDYQPRYALLINEDDGQGRNIMMEYAQVPGAIGTLKDSSFFSDMFLAAK